MHFLGPIQCWHHYGYERYSDWRDRRLGYTKSLGFMANRFVLGASETAMHQILNRVTHSI